MQLGSHEQICDLYHSDLKSVLSGGETNGSIVNVTTHKIKLLVRKKQHRADCNSATLGWHKRLRFCNDTRLKIHLTNQHTLFLIFYEPLWLNIRGREERVLDFELCLSTQQASSYFIHYVLCNVLS